MKPLSSIAFSCLRLLPLLALEGCAVAAVAGAAAGAAVSVTGAVVSTTVKVGGKVVEKTIDAVTPSSEEDKALQKPKSSQ